MTNQKGSGLRAPAPFFAAATAMLTAASAGAQTQSARPPQTQPARPPQTQPARPPQAQIVQPQVQPQTIPDVLLASKLIWSTMAAVDHANLTGNYSVLRDLGSPSFQANNNPATLAGVFASIRNSRLDLSNTLLLAPTLEFAPTIVQGGLLRLRGSFGLRPIGAAFDLLYQNVGGSWRLFGVAVVPLQMGNLQTAPQPAPVGRR